MSASSSPAPLKRVRPQVLRPLHPAYAGTAPEMPLPTLRLADARWPRPFAGGIEYSPPARGPWTIVHIGMLMPEMHEIFVCAQACLRGVVLSAAEMNVQDRFSTITVTEEHFRDGRLEEAIIEGTEKILSELPRQPRAVLLYTSCVHHFTGADIDWALKVLRRRFAEIEFIDAYMTPTFRKTEMPPDNKMRLQLYQGLKPAASPRGGVLLAGTLEPFGPRSTFARLAAAAGVPFYELAGLTRYDDYLQMANARIAVTINPAAKQAGESLRDRLGMTWLSLPLSYDEAEIEQGLAALAQALGLTWGPDSAAAERARAAAALEAARQALDGRPVAICQTATTRPAGLALRLVQAGIRVTDLFADSFLPADKPAFDALRTLAPDIRVHPTTTPEMRFAPRRTASGADEGLVAIGQKAAWFTGASHMVNLIEGGPLWGHSGVAALAERLAAAARHPADVMKIIRIKGYGCLGGECQSEEGWI